MDKEAGATALLRSESNGRHPRRVRLRQSSVGRCESASRRDPHIGLLPHSKHVTYGPLCWHLAHHATGCARPEGSKNEHDVQWCRMGCRDEVGSAGHCNACPRHFQYTVSIWVDAADGIRQDAVFHDFDLQNFCRKWALVHPWRKSNRCFCGGIQSASASAAQRTLLLWTPRAAESK